MPRIRTSGQRSAVHWLLFGFKGRISRRVYWPSYLALLLLNLALFRQLSHLLVQDRVDGAILLAFTLAGLVVLFAHLAVSVKRLHDMGYAGFLAIAVAIPLIGLAFSIWVGIPPGTAGPNRYGDAADSPPKGV